MTELRKIGLDVKAGNFLIPQGYIACVAMKKPKDLTAMFEKITNSNEYKADYDRYIFVLIDGIMFVVKFDKSRIQLSLFRDCSQIFLFLHFCFFFFFH